MKWLESGLLLVAVLSSVHAAPTPLADEDSSRLPHTSKPIHYDLQLKSNVHLGNSAFDGFVIITIEIVEDTNLITLHNRGLTIEEVKLLDNANVEVQINPLVEDKTKEFVLIQTVSKSLQAGERYTVEITYTGRLSTGTDGFYRSSYKVGSETRYLAATQFESTAARTALVCYDEPEFKAEFTVQIVHGSEYSAVSNTDGSSFELEEGWTMTTFETTPEMSSYLLAFLVSDFGVLSTEQTHPGETIHRIYARPQDIERTAFALGNSFKLLKALEIYAKYDYELKKMDSAAIPDFGAGAMENWGSIFYKEQYLIGDENSHPRDVMRIMTVIAHELGHQFFGNVVTCKWWSYIWLNEGFATLFEYLLVDETDSDSSLRMNDFFNVEKVQNAFKVDSVESSHPMTFDGSTITGIIYDKAGSVIRMFQNAVGEDIFRDSLSLYLRDNAHSPVTSDNLYEAFETVIGQGESLGFAFTEAFKTWENQKGYPIIQLTLLDSANEFIITQERYYAASETRVADDKRSWYIPLSFATASNPNFEDTKFTDFFVNGESFKAIKYPAQFDSTKWFIFNIQQIGFYRVNYESNNWNELIKILNSDNFEQIHVLNRAQLIDDSLSLAADGYLDYKTAFGILSYLKRETDYIPWRAAINNFDKLDFLLKGTPAHDSFTKFAKQLIRRSFVKQGFVEKPQDSLIDKFAREQAIDWTCRFGDEKCLADAYMHVKQAVDEQQDLPDSLEIVYICHGLKGLNKQDLFEEFWNRMQSSTDQAERIRIIDGLMCSTDPTALKSLLETVLVNGGETYYRTHERQRILNNVLVRSPIGLEVTVEFISEFYDEILSAFGGSAVNSLISALSKRVVSYEDQVMLTGLISDLGEKVSEDTKTAATKNIDDNKMWVASARYLDILDSTEDVENQLILPKTSEPMHYSIHIDARNIHTGATAFTGEVEIEALIKENTDYIMIHSKTQVIDELKVFKKNDMTEIELLDYNLYPAADTLTIYFTETLAQNAEIIIHIKYSTNLLTSGSGFYQTSYDDMDGVKHFLGATQFESTNARFAFPHYDEPANKVVFDLKITHDKSLKAIANMPEHEVANLDGTTTTTFDPTPPMSSYLLAFVVSDLQYISNADKPEETLHRIWVRPDSLLKAEYALRSSVEALKALEDYVDFKFELPKVDSVGVPNKGGAMENWGMVTYRENAMIYEENYEDIIHSVKLSGVDVIHHELAHQFFGDSVTCEWWDYIWLNEGFATLFEFHLMGINHPEWRTVDFFNLRELQSAFRSDSRESSRAMTSSLLTPTEISRAFDYVVYNKAGSVLRMFQHAVGEEIFKKSLNSYLTTNNHKAVNSQHLVDAFKIKMAELGFSDFDFGKAFRTWELQAGYPVITVTFQANNFQITQERYFTEKQEISTDTSSWYIPLNFATESNPDFEDTTITDYFLDDQETATVAAPSGFDATQWFVFNKQQLGYYRVNYDYDNWQALILTLNSDKYDKIHVLNRAQLVDDTINFAAGGYIEYDVTFGILGYLSRETEYTPWNSADQFISQLYTTFGSSNKDLNTYVHQLTETFYDAFKVPDIIPFEEVYERYSRELALKLACNSGNVECLADAAVQDQRVAIQDRPVPKGLENVSYCSGFRGTGNRDAWIAMWQKMQATSDSTFKANAIRGLGCTDDQALLKDYLESTLGTNGNSVNYTRADRYSVFNSVLNSYSGLEAVIRFMEDFELDIISAFEQSLETLLTTIARIIKSRDQQAMFNEYLFAVADHLEIEAFRRVSVIPSDNIGLQSSIQNANIIAIIRKIVAVEPEPTDAPTTPAPDTTVPTIPGETTDAPDTTVPTIPQPATESTTLGAAPVKGVNFLMIVAGFLFTLSLKVL